MKFFSLDFLMLLHTVRVVLVEESSWCYEVQVCSTGCKGPRNWKHIYSECGGSQQSPVNIMTKNTTYNSLLRPFQFKGYNVTHAVPITNNGHSALVDLPTDAQISGGGFVGVYEAKQLHFHWGSADIAGSEHTIDGERYLMELHVVHRRKAIKEENISISKGDMAVLGFFFEESENENENYTNIMNAIGRIHHKGDTTFLNVTLQELIPEPKDLALYFRYQGSLTTPPCSEIVTWTLFTKTIKLSRRQFQAIYTSLYYHGNIPMVENFRPVNKLGARQVFTSDSRALVSKLCGYI